MQTINRSPNKYREDKSFIASNNYTLESHPPLQMATSTTTDSDYPKINNNNKSNDYFKIPHKLNNNNYEMNLSKTIEGNGFVFWTIVLLVLILTIGNLILTMTIIGVLGIGKGMAFLELVPEANTVEFFGITDLDRIYKKDGLVEGFADVPMTITGDNGNVIISLAKGGNGHSHTKMLMGKTGTHFNGINQFDIKNPQTTETIFSTHKPNFNLTKPIDNLTTKIMSTSRLTSAIDESLNLNNTRGKILFRGTEGVALDGKEIVLSVDQNLHFKTHNGSIVLTGSQGIFVDINSIPIVGDHGIKIENKQYKICVCMPYGKLFRVAVAPSSHIVKGICSHYNAKHDPCV